MRRYGWIGRERAPRARPAPPGSNRSAAATPRACCPRGQPRGDARPGARGSEHAFTLVYLDPPFFTGRMHARVDALEDPADGQCRPRSLTARRSTIAGATGRLPEALSERIAAARELLAPDGCLVVHVDPKTSHYAKVLCDEVFGPELLRERDRVALPALARADTELSARARRAAALRARSEQKAQVSPALRAAGSEHAHDLGRQKAARSGRQRRAARALQHDAETTPGTPLGDVWEIGIVAPVARERTGYPTQKPEALLDAAGRSVHRPRRSGARSVRRKRHDASR